MEKWGCKKMLLAIYWGGLVAVKKIPQQQVLAIEIYK
jgi:hypothetical protein